MQQSQQTPPPGAFMAHQGRVQSSPGPKYFTQQTTPAPIAQQIPLGALPSQNAAPPMASAVPAPMPAAGRIAHSGPSQPHVTSGQNLNNKRHVVQQPVPTILPQSTLIPNARPPSQPVKKRRRLADKVIPPEIGELVPEYHAYMNFLAFERKLDSFITRKRLEIQECLKRPIKVKRKLRIYVSHTFYPGKVPEKETDEGQIAQWELRVEGKLMDDETVKQQPQTQQSNQQTMLQQQAQVPKRKFSSFFKSLVIELDKDIYGPDNHLVEWHRTPTTNETDGFQVKRPGDRSVKCTILLLLDHAPMKFKLDPRLARLLGLHTETRPKIIEALWEYIKKHKLQDQHERDHINCDKYLEQTFQCQRMRFMEIPQRLNALLLPPDPIVINHVITCNTDGTEPKRTACYDIDVEIEDPIKMKMNQFLETLRNQNDITACDNRIYEIVEQIQQVKLQREFFLGFAQDPKVFIEKWTISQSKDLQLMTDANGEPEEERKSEYYKNSWLHEAVGRYFYGKVQQKRAELEQALGVRNS